VAGKRKNLSHQSRQYGQVQCRDDSQIVQSIPGHWYTANGRNLSTAVFMQDNTFYTGRNDFAKQFKLTNGALTTTPVEQATRSVWIFC